MRKRVWRILLALCLLAALYPAAMAADSGVCGADGSSVYWNIDSDGLLTIRGSGAMEDFNQNNIPWFQNGHRPAIRRVYVEYGVTRVGNYAFHNCPNLTGAYLPRNLRGIGDYAFSECVNLAEIAMEEGVRTIGKNAFNNCRMLEQIDLPSAVTSIDQGAFRSCESLTEIVIPDGVKALESYTFRYCSSLTGVSLPENLTEIGQRVFGDCTALREIFLPRRVRTIGVFAFENCTRLESVTLPASMTAISEGTFSGCIRLETVTVPNGITEIQRAAFQNCAALTDVIYEATKAKWASVVMTDFRQQISQNGIRVHCTDDGNTGLLAVIERVSVDSMRVTVTISGTPGVGSTLFVGFYGPDDKFMGTRSREVNEAGTFTVPDIEGAESVKAFLVDSVGKPVAEAKRQSAV